MQVMQYLVKHALALLRESPEYVADAREGAPVGNSVVGSLLNLQFHEPREATEAAVREAIWMLDQDEGEQSVRVLNVSMTDDEHRRLRETAAESGRPITALARDALKAYGLI